MSSGIEIDNLTIPTTLSDYLTPYPKTEFRALPQEEMEEYTSITGFNSVNAGGGFGIPVEGYLGMKESTISLKGFYTPEADPVTPIESLTPSPKDLEYVKTVRDLCTPIIERLDALPSPKAIAHFLRDERVLGKDTDPRDCPLANYFTAMTQLDIEVHTQCLAVTCSFTSTVYGRHGSKMEETREMRILVVNLPEKLQRFVSRFDGGKYRYLRRSA